MLSRKTLLIFLLSVLYRVPSQAQNLDLSGIAHVAFRVGNYEDSRRFYEALGFEQAFEFADPGKPRQSFIKVNDRQFLELYEKSADSKPGFMHICFETSDIESLHSAYAKLGVAPTEVRKFHAGNLLFVVHDPGGQLVEYTQYLPGSLHSTDRGKHLGSSRISERLVESATPAPDPSAEHDYYAKLGFQPIGGNTLLRLPGTSGQEIELQSHAGSPPKIAFAVDNVKHAQKTLRQRKIKFEKHGASIDLTDPDGNIVMLTAAKAR
jgi:catechol 2,3-dioxygenase-like lactoylglutathione lyase family enzyme